MHKAEEQELADAVLELIHTDSDTQRAIVDVVCSCPSITVQY